MPSPAGHRSLSPRLELTDPFGLPSLHIDTEGFLIFHAELGGAIARRFASHDQRESCRTEASDDERASQPKRFGSRPLETSQAIPIRGAKRFADPDLPNYDRDCFGGCPDS